MMIVKWFRLVLVILILAATGCSFLPSRPAADTALIDNVAVHTRKMLTPAYAGNKGAIIFTLNHVEDCGMAGATESILRVFAENSVPLDAAVQPDSLAKRQDLLSFLRNYTDAGIIDISIGGSDVNWVDVDSHDMQNAIAELKAQLSAKRAGISRYFGTQVSSCVFPYESLNEQNYKCLSDSGFTVLSTRNPEGFSASRQPVNWRMMPDPSGLMRLPIVGMVNYRDVSDLRDINNQIINAVNKSLERPGIAVIEIDPAYFVGTNNQVDLSMIQQLDSLIKSAISLGEVVTFDGWNRYAADYITVTPVKRVMPAYKGGTAIIFRLDDVCKGWHEEADKEIINVFKSNGVPLDCGVISNANNTDSYDIPWLKDYLNDGWVGISVHGYDWTYYQLDTTKSNLSYEFIKLKLLKARDQYLKYFGVSPVAITVPTDFYDETGYKAIEDAGFKVFATQLLIEPHPSTQPVDYYGRSDPEGLYRIPTAADVCIWDADGQMFTDVIDPSKLPDIKEACLNYSADPYSSPDRSFVCSLCTELNDINIGAIGIHPSAFVDKDGKPDTFKIQKLDAIVKWAKRIGTVTTFEQWYNYSSSRNLP